MRNLIKIFSLLAILAVCTFAADVNGKWKGSIETPNGAREQTLTFKVDGDKLTGSVSGRQNDSPIQDGKVSGENISFVVVRNFGGNDMKFEYKGKVTGDEIKFDVTAGERSFQMTVKKM